MRLGTQTGSMTNHILSRAVKGQPDPAVGMGATILAWTDRYPATIISVGKFRRRPMVEVQEDTATRIDTNGMSECQEYTFTPNPQGRKRRFAQDTRGIWRELGMNDRGREVFAEGYGLRIGERGKYHDFSF